MTFEKYANTLNIITKTEFDKVSYTAFFLYKYEGKSEFLLNDIFKLLEQINVTISNHSRIKNKLKTSKRYRKIKKDTYTITSNGINELTPIIDEVLNTNCNIITNNCLFDLSLFIGARGYLDILFKQVDNCYNNNCYDACAVLVRRIFEILLIESYQNLGITSEIKNSSDNYVMLESICTNAKGNKILNLSRNTKEALDDIRDLGNFAAHKITYNTRKSDIDKLYNSIRTCFEELYYKAGFKK